MSAKHILIEKAFVYKKRRENFEYGNYIYDYLLGYWIKKDNGKPAVYDPEFSGPKTKKADIETGEDQKGE